MSRIRTCRSCGSSRLNSFLSLSTPPLANALLSEKDLDQPEERYPLELVLCAGCSLVQLTEDVPPERLFREYCYFSSYSDGMACHASRGAQRLIESRGLGAESLVVEIGSNDGYMLRNFVAAGVPVLGIDPARNVAQTAIERGVRTIAEFFSHALASRLARGGIRADVILANNVMAHVPDPERRGRGDRRPAEAGRGPRDGNPLPEGPDRPAGIRYNLS